MALGGGWRGRGLRLGGHGRGVGGRRWGTRVHYLGLHHVHPPRPQLPHAVVDVHHSFPLGHVQHDVNDDETAGPARTSTARRGGLSKRGQKGPRCCFLLDPCWGEIHRTWNDHQKVYNSVAPGTLAMLCDHRLCLVPKHFHHPKGARTRCPHSAPTHLQCTTKGPALGGLLDFTCRTKPSSPVAW